jgi:uncharacterized protein YkwD
MQGWKRARTLRLIVALFALSLTLSACETGDLLEFLNGHDLAPPVADTDDDAEEPAPAPDDEEPPADEPAPDDGEPPADEPAPDDDGAAAELSAIEQEIFDRLNERRADAGLNELTLNADIAAGASEWSRNMAETGNFAHADLAEANVSGENIAMGQRSAAEVDEGWTNSPGHNDNRMSDRWTQYGVGVYEDDEGRLWFTERFDT